MLPQKVIREPAIVSWLCNYTISNCLTWTERNWKSAETHSRDGINHAVCDLVLPHVFHYVELGRSLLWYDLVSDLLQLGVKLLKQILKQQRQKLEERTNNTWFQQVPQHSRGSKLTSQWLNQVVKHNNAALSCNLLIRASNNPVCCEHSNLLLFINSRQHSSTSRFFVFLIPECHYLKQPTLLTPSGSYNISFCVITPLGAAACNNQVCSCSDKADLAFRPGLSHPHWGSPIAACLHSAILAYIKTSRPHWN